MKTLCLAFYSEGDTDDRFLPRLITRIVEPIIARAPGEMIDLAPIYVVSRAVEKKSINEGAEQILMAAALARRSHLLIVHKDADERTPDTARRNCFEPGQRLVQEAEQKVCKELLPLIPIHMMEAWILADYEMVLEVLGVKMKLADLKKQLKSRSMTLPAKPRQVEKNSKPKHTLEQIVGIVCGHSNVNLGELYEPLSDRIRLERLAQVPAFQQFEQELTNALRKLHMAE